MSQMKRKRSSTTLQARMEKLQKQYDAAKKKFGETDSRYTKDLQRLRMNNALEKIRTLKKNNPDVFKGTKTPPPPPAAPKSTKSIFGGGTPPGERALKNIGEKVRAKKPPKPKPRPDKAAKSPTKKAGEAKGTGQMQRRGPGPKQRGPGLRGKKEEEFKGIDAPRIPKLKPLGPAKDIKQRPEPKGPRDQARKPLPAEKEMRPRTVQTRSRRAGEDDIRGAIERATGIRLTGKSAMDMREEEARRLFPDSPDPLQDMEEMERGNRRKGGMFTRRGPLYTKGKKAKS